MNNILTNKNEPKKRKLKSKKKTFQSSYEINNNKFKKQNNRINNLPGRTRKSFSVLNTNNNPNKNKDKEDETDSYTDYELNSLQYKNIKKQ